MYTVLSGIGRRNVAGSKWIEEDFANKRILDVVSMYDKVYFKVSSDNWDEASRVVTLGTLIPRIKDYSHTVQQVFDSQGNETIPSIVGEAVVEERYVKMADAVQAGYSFKRVLMTQHPDTPTTPYEAQDLAMTKSGVDPRDFRKHCLVSINGLIHLDDADDETIYVMDAQRTSMQSRRNEVGIINFKDIGELTKIRITADMVHRRLPDQAMMHQVYVQVPNAPKDKTAMLVMGGYLHVMDAVTFFRVADDIFCIDMQNCKMIDRYLESRKILNFDGIFEYELYGANGAQFIREQLLSDENLIRYLTMSQSFIVFVDTDSIRTDRERVDTGRSFGQYVVGTRPRSPLVLGFGLLPPYWVRPDDLKWSITVGDNIRNNLLLHTTEEDSVPNPADNRIPYDREEISPANLWHIYSETLVVVQPRTATTPLIPSP